MNGVSETLRLYQYEELSKSGSYILIDEYDLPHCAEFGKPAMYMAISNSIGIKGYYWVAELPLLTRENLSVDTKGAYFRLPDEVMAEGSRIGENDRFLGPLTTSWAYVKHVRILKEKERDARKTTAMYRVQIGAPHCPPGIPHGYCYWSIDI